VTVRLDWGEEQLEAVVRATRAVVEEVPDRDAVPTPDQEGDKDLPPALAMMLEERRATERDAADAAVRAAIVTLPTGVWREIQGRASSTGVTAELLEEGAQVRLVAPLPALIAAPETGQAEG
jgi:hypothetical protein